MNLFYIAMAESYTKSRGRDDAHYNIYMYRAPLV